MKAKTKKQTREVEKARAVALAREIVRQMFDEHDNHHLMRNTPEWVAWRDARQRCTNPHCAVFRYYGGRPDNPIRFEFSSYKQFYNSLGPRPEGMTLERKDNSKGYTPQNCVWDTWAAQAANKRKPQRKAA